MGAGLGLVPDKGVAMAVTKPIIIEKLIHEVPFSARSEDRSQRLSLTGRLVPGALGSGIVIEDRAAEKMPPFRVQGLKRGLAAAAMTGRIAGYPMSDFCVVVDDGTCANASERKMEVLGRAVFFSFNAAVVSLDQLHLQMTVRCASDDTDVVMLLRDFGEMLDAEPTTVQSPDYARIQAEISKLDARIEQLLAEDQGGAEQEALMEKMQALLDEQQQHEQSVIDYTFLVPAHDQAQIEALLKAQLPAATLVRVEAGEYRNVWANDLADLIAKAKAAGKIVTK